MNQRENTSIHAHYDGNVPKDRDNVHENLRAGWSNNMTRQLFSRYVVDNSLKAQQRAQHVISDEFLANKHY